ncbi:prolyl oligopeptidase family serine peptidase [Conexibacter stalactiti]|uniref:Prolyl oligopeptidase family serine peptidase n=1 Tax=Conexibacter stalactiti TaxID=1940611 RepID=A0ABU4HQ53_9ACTN|nr:prolyl oligopeptidase family serine peptidase [Conexibacter stalactiti]MDW5594832.1 prolyl oligopeptidase family serine peptidase [Conexibacter stalactiti]MEC5035474.1 prolyl oligopeptidase family serine peptidase [Conexibacter stalactiti]
MSARFDGAVLRRLRWLQEAALQPLGDLVAYTLRVRGEDPSRETVELWWHDLRSGEETRVDSGGADVASLAWSASGRWLAVRLRHGGRWRLAIVAAGAAWAAPRGGLTGEPTGACAWHGDDRLALVLAREEERCTPREQPYRTTDEVWERDGVGRVDRAGSDLWELRLGEREGESEREGDGDDGDRLRRLTCTPSAKAAPVWSPSGERLLFEQRALERIRGTTLRLLDRDGGDAELVPSSYRPFASAWADERTVVFAGVAPGSLAGTQEDLFVVAAQPGARPADRSSELPGAVGGFLDGDLPSAAWWDPTPIVVGDDGADALVRVHAGGSCELRRIALAGPQRSELVLGGPRACQPCGITADGALLALVASFDQLPELVLRDAGGGERRLTDLNGAALDGIALAPLRPLLHRTPRRDGIDAWFAAPPDGGAGPWPTVALLHGGPHAASGQLPHVDAQLLLAHGIAVLLVNHHGSMGYDDAFGVSLRGRWAQRTCDDVLTAVDAAVARGWADPARLGVHGQSAGGTLTCWLACRTGRFMAAAAENAATNFVSLLGSSDIGSQLLPDLLGPPGPGLREWLAQSPVADAHSCRTPLLLIQAEADRRCPPEQGEQLYRLLRLHGRATEMVRIPGGTHDASVLGPPPMREAQEAALTAWFVEHLIPPHEEHEEMRER